MASLSGRHILHITGSLDVGGSQAVVRRLATCAAQDGADVTVCRLGQPSEAERPLTLAGVRVIGPEHHRAGLLGLILQIFWLSVTRKVDLVQTHLTISSLLGLAASATPSGPATIATFHGRHTGWRRLAPAVLSRCHDQTACVSSAVARHLVNDCYASPARLRIMHNGVNVGGPARRPKSTRALVIGAVGALVEHKGQRLLLESFALTADRFPEAELRIVGEGPDRRLLEARAEELGLGNRVVFTGQLHSASGEISQMDCLVVPSTFEGFSLVIIEAMALGVPSAATRCGGPEELIVSQVGALAEENTPQGLADAISSVLTLGRDHFAAACRARYLAHFTEEAMWDRYRHLYLEMLADAP